MANKKTARRALFSSVLALILCCCMLVGTTFAWFTDSVTSAGNIIKSGTLDVTMEWYDGTKAVPAVDSADWKDASQGAIFDYKLWEPGYTEVRHIKISNEGSLALKYQLSIAANGTVSKLADVIDVYYVDPAVPGGVTDRTMLDGSNKLGTLTQALAGMAESANGNLLAGENVTLTIALKMRETAGNEYQDKAIGSDFSIVLLATQYTHEEDSFDEKYDEGANLVLASNTEELMDAIDAAAGTAATIKLGTGEYKMPSSSASGAITITGTEDAILDMTMGAYMESANVTIDGVTIKTGTGKVNGNGSDYAALYTPNVTYKNCTFVGPMRVGRDGAKFVNCTFTALGNDYIWTYGNDVIFEGCTFNTAGKAILIYSDGGNEVAEVSVKNCIFKSTQGAKAGAIANQNCAAIEIHNYGNGVELTTSGNTYDSNFSGEWRIKTYETGRTKISVNGTEYTTIAIDGKIMTIDANKNVTVNG